MFLLLVVIALSNDCEMENCQECEFSDCDRCVDGYSFLYSSQDYTYKCVRCHNSCKQCDGKTDQVCTEC